MVRTSRRSHLGLECLESRLTLSATGASTPPATAFTPGQVRSAYGIDRIFFDTPAGRVAGDGSGQTIAILEVGHNPTLIDDLRVFSQYFNLPDPPSIQVLNSSGQPSPLPSGGGAIRESDLDVQWAHAIAPGARILVIECGSFYNVVGGVHVDDFGAAIEYLVNLPADQRPSVVSMSYSAPETAFAPFTPTFPQGSLVPFPFSDGTYKGITFLGSAGDNGAGFQEGKDGEVHYRPMGYPSGSPDVVQVGATTLRLVNGQYGSEIVWGHGSLSDPDKDGSTEKRGSGGGYSEMWPRPAYQQGVSLQNVPPDILARAATRRLGPDVAFLGDPSTGVAVVSGDLYGLEKPWLDGADGGTSLATPLFAGLMAIVNQGRSLEGLQPLDGPLETLPLLYQAPTEAFHDVTQGNNGYPAGPGFDLASGLGTPNAPILAQWLVGYDGKAEAIVPAGGSFQEAKVGEAFGSVLEVRVTDQLGNPVQGANVTFSAPVSGASGRFPGDAVAVTVPTNASGLASIAFQANGTAGIYSVRAGVAGVETPATFVLVNRDKDKVEPGDTKSDIEAAAVRLVAGSGQGATVTQAFANNLVVRVVDAAGKPLHHAAVTFQVPLSGASGYFAFNGGATTVTAVTNAQGLATAPPLLANTVAGTYRVKAQVDGFAAPAFFTLTNRPGAVARVEVGSGDGQSARIGQLFAAPLVATVTDAFGNPVRARVLFQTAIAGRAGILPRVAVVTTNRLGQAILGRVRANSYSGIYRVYATVAGTSQPAVFTLSNTPAAPARMLVVGLAAQSADVNEVYASSLAVRLVDALGNAVTGVQVTFTLPSAGAGGDFVINDGQSPHVKQVVVTTDGSGLALSPRVKANATAGSFQVTATLPGIRPVVFRLTNEA